MATVVIVPCPICNKMVEMHGINKHIDSGCRFYIAKTDKNVDCNKKPVIKCNYADVDISTPSSDDTGSQSQIKQVQKQKLKTHNINPVQCEKKSNDDEPHESIPYFHFDSDLSDFETDYSTPPSIERYRKMPSYHARLSDPPPIIFRSNKNRKNKKQKLKESVLSGIFSNAQSHEQYLSFHADARLKYSQILNASSKANKYKNRKNYFLLPILTKFGHIIGDRIGAKDYKFDCANILDVHCLTGRRGDDYYGVDYKIDEKDEENQDLNAAINPIALVNEIMQMSKVRNWRFIGYVSHGIKYCQFILENEIVGECRGRNKQIAKTKCAESVLHELKTNPVYSHRFASIIIRKELGIRGAIKQKKEKLIGYEYPAIPPRYGYQIMQSDDCIQLVKQKHHNLVVFKDRGMFLNDSLSIEKLYINAFVKKQIKFNVKKQIPMHCHSNLDDYGNLIGVIKDYNRREAWKQIKRVYDGNCVSAKPKWKYFVIYDFDGTVYANRLYNTLNYKLFGQDPDDYIDKLDIVHGFGGIERVQALEQHFAEVRLHQPHLGVVLHTFHRYHHLKKLFVGIGINMDEWFDVVLCFEHDIVKSVESERLKGKTENYSKNMATQMFCDRYKIPLENVLYVDDSRYAKDDVVCCRLLTIQNKGGMKEKDMKEIVQIMKYKMNN